jgi:hypothetical protein
MNAVTSSRTRNGAGYEDCGCGCASCRCDSQCCELECLLRPNFYCGQVLTDADLAALVEWTRSRLSLARHRDGWGIACGLELSCSAPGTAAGCAPRAPQPGAGPSVWVGSGYALDCCGDDLVLCEPLAVDLSPVCRPAFDPCDPNSRPPGRPTGQPDGANGGDCLHLDAGELVAVQLSLRYAEAPAHGQRALFRGTCNDDGPCQYARIREQPCVHLEEVPLAAPAVEDEGERWREAFEAGLARQVATVRAAILGGSQTVLKLLRHAPPYRYCFLEELVCCLHKKEGAETPIGPAQWWQIARLIVLDWMLRQLECPCDTCQPDTGVPLGRVILRRRMQDRTLLCSVVMVEQAAPWRRRLRRDPCRPQVAGIDLAPLLGQPASALDGLRERDIDVQVIDAQAASSEDLAAMIGRLATAVVSHDPAGGGGLAVFLVDDVLGVTRIAAFVRTIPL